MSLTREMAEAPPPAGAPPPPRRAVPVGLPLALALLVIIGSCAAMIVAQARIDALRPARSENELLYLPNQHLLNHLTGGMDTIIADMIWLQCVQYTAKEAKGARNFTWLQHMLNTVVRLDPNFVDAYRYGAIFLSALKADSDAGLDLLKRGMVANPRAWELPYEAAMNYLLNRKDAPDARRQAAFYLSLSAATGNAPQLVTDVAAKLGAEQELSKIERDMWLSLRQSSDELLRDMAERKLKEMELREVVKMLNAGIKIFSEKVGRPPSTLEEMMQAGLLKAMPPDPMGGKYLIDINGRAQSSTLLEGTKAQHAALIQAAIDKFKEKEGAYPQSLEMLLASGYISRLPENPYAGENWKYDSVTGKVE